MKNKLALLISVLITAALLTVAIGVVKNVNARNNQPVANPTPTLVDTSTREQAYQQLIADANAKIAQANQQIETLMNQMPTVSTQTASPYLFSAEQAATLAMNVAGLNPKALPELVNFNNTPAFEAVFSNGKVYIDANTGRVLFNGLQAAPVRINADQAVAIATKYLNRSDVVSIDVAPLNGTSVYVIGFSDGTLVYVDITGQIVAIQMPSQNTSSTYSESSEKNDD